MLPRSHSIVIDSSSTIELFPYSAPSSAPHNRAISQTGSVVACLLLSLLLTHGRGNPLVLTSVLFLAHWLYKKESKVYQLAQFSCSVYLWSQKADRCRVHLDIRRKRPRCWSTLKIFRKDFTQSS